MSTKNLLKSIAAGEDSVSSLRGEVRLPEDLQIDWNFCNMIEMSRAINTLRKYGLKKEDWPVTELIFFENLKREETERLKPDFFDRIMFWYKYESAHFYKINYKDVTKRSLFQIEVGTDRESHPNVRYPEKHFERFVHFNLNEWESEIDFSKIIKPELPLIAEILHRDMETTPRLVSHQKFIDDFANDTQSRERIDEKYDNKEGITTYTIHYRNGSTKYQYE